MTHREIKLYQNIKCNLLNALLSIQILCIFWSNYIARKNKIFPNTWDWPVFTLTEVNGKIELTSVVFCPSYYNSSQGNIALLLTSVNMGFPLGYVLLYKAVTLRKILNLLLSVVLNYRRKLSLSLIYYEFSICLLIALCQACNIKFLATKPQQIQ